MATQAKPMLSNDIAPEKGSNFHESIMGLHVFTGKDVASAFKGKGKVGPIKNLQKNPKYIPAFPQLEND